jgi:hypothetical protein
MLMLSNLNVIQHRKLIAQTDVLKRAGKTPLRNSEGTEMMNIPPFEFDAPRRRLIHPGEEVEERGFSGSIRADQPFQRTRWKIMREARDGFQSPKRNTDIL